MGVFRLGLGVVRLGWVGRFRQLQVVLLVVPRRLLTRSSADEPAADLAVIGGSGFYELFDSGRDVETDTPYGPPSAPVRIGHIADRPVAFLPRHGLRHELPPHRIPYRANVWALRQLGVTRVLAPSAAGSLRGDVHPGDLVVCDQLVDRTSGRADTYFEGPNVQHVSFADPYCAEMRSVVTAAAAAPAAEHGSNVHAAGTMVVIQGPRFSTRAESRWYRAAGWDVIGMTQYPEAVLARELGLCYCGLALVTDYDTGVEGDDSVGAVSMDAVFEVLREMVGLARAVVAAAVPTITTARSCTCAPPTGVAAP
ncbi:MAG TPA: S-methyl-5'-thioadenosine phosphorylase [Acidimicrobiales bacterium]|nr:S-methyl-5'-thioadenosine phosphorylase [Acidimicrobiales bacterium]